ncbi:MAG: hypothetical protein DWP94_07565 [Flavobacterium sp.]|nr:MAG: hypothetical protein DWP94_07565 [Flavobacterium sp.]
MVLRKGIITICFLSSSLLFAQGKIDGFYRGQNNGTIVLGLGFEDGKKYFAGEENGKLDLSRSVFYSSIFGAYGITDNLDVNVTIPYIVSDDNANFQDIAIYLKYRVAVVSTATGRFEFSMSGGFSTNLTDYDLGGLNDIGQQATVIDSRGLVHYQWSTGWFATAQSGFSFKSDPTPNSIPFTLKLGRASSNWYYDVYYDFQHSFGGTDYLGTPRPQDFRAFGVDFHKVGGTVYRPFSDSFGIYASLSYVFDGRNIFLGAGYGLGAVYNFRSNQSNTK